MTAHSCTADNCSTHARRRWLRTGLLIALVLVVAGGAYALYLFNMPHRDVVAAKADAAIDGSALVAEFLSDAPAANLKYLDAEGESKVLAVTGTVSAKETDLEGHAVVLLKEPGDKAGVRCSFTSETDAQAASLTEGGTVTIKGVIRAGASFDPDLDLYEHVVLEKCSLVK